MSERFENCTLAIIAGGRGNRLGGIVKAQLRLPDGRTILDRMLELISPLVDEVLIVANDPAPFAASRVVPDVIPSRGAPGGVHAACAAARTEWVLALASDLPCVTPDVLRWLWEKRSDADAVVASLEQDRFEPLHAFYRARTCTKAFEDALLAGEPSFSELFQAVRIRTVSGNELGAIDPELRSFVNINTFEDLKRAGLSLPPAPMPGVTRRPVVRVGREGGTRLDEVAVEEPLEIRLDGDTVAVTMRTPGDDERLVLGFLLAEGIIRSLDDVGTISHCGRPGSEGYGNVIDVRSGSGAARAPRTLDSRRWNVTSSACGVCGRQSIRDLLTRCQPVEKDERVSAEIIALWVEQLSRSQPNFSRTGGLHAAAAFDGTGQLLACQEDVGRHNAVDKVIGRLLQQGRIGAASSLIVSGRASFEIVQKAVAARIPIVVSVSAPSSLAIDLAESTGVTLISFARGPSFNVCTHPERVVI